VTPPRPADWPLFERAEALGVSVVGPDDLERLLDAIQARETELMLLRHAVTRALAGLPRGGEP
jgi:hypothetical protein